MTLVARASPTWTGVCAALAVVGGVLPAMFGFLVARLVERLPNAVQEGFSSVAGRRVVVTLVAFGVILLAQEVADAVQAVAHAELYRRYEEYLRTRIMDMTLASPRLELFEETDLAASADRLVGGARDEPGDLVDGLLLQWGCLAQGLGATVLVVTVWPVAAVVALAGWLVTNRYLQADYRRTWAASSFNMRRASYLRRLALLPEWSKEIRVFGLVHWVADRFGRQWALAMAQLWKARRVGRTATVLLMSAVAATNAVVLVLAARSAGQGTLGVGSLTLLVQGLWGMALLAQGDGGLRIDWGVAGLPDLLQLEQATAERQAPDPAGHSVSSRGGRVASGPAGLPATGHPAREIRFESVHFTYPGQERPVFDGLDLHIEAFRSLAVVGLNGAGKTTLIKLLAGLEVPEAGRILVDDVDLAEIDLVSWRKTVAAIFQDFVHYELPVRDNIGFGAVESLPDPGTPQRLERAARRAGADRILAGLPSGLETPLSRRFPGGVDLSGGQWQRIALARAMAAVEAGARLLILDEPTAQLDVRAEADVYNRFLDLTQGLTTMVISHRFSTVRRADRIVVLELGRITEDGTHDTLVQAGGHYAQLFRRQAARYVTAETDPGYGDADVENGDA